MPNPAAEPPSPFNAASIQSRAEKIPWDPLEQIVHLDPAGRGLASFRRDGAPLDAGQLRAAAVHLAQHARRVGLLAGFPVVTPAGVVAETDGPPGALFLARALVTLGVDVFFLADRIVRPLIECGLAMWQLDRRVHIVDVPPIDDDRWAHEFLASDRGRQMSHLIAIERPSPSHTLDTIAAQGATAHVVAQFAASVPLEHRGLCHNMRGETIHAHVAPTHYLFDALVAQRRNVTTIGIGDGGNEIGIGRYDWPTLCEAVASPDAPHIAARVPADYAIVAGVSDWGAYALALALTRLRDGVALAAQWNEDAQRALIEALVRDTPAVDGLTHRREPTVDGLPLDVYLQPLAAMRKLLGYSQ